MLFYYHKDKNIWIYTVKKILEFNYQRTERILNSKSKKKYNSIMFYGLKNLYNLYKYILFENIIIMLLCYYLIILLLSYFF